jgi:hypothetical protein
MIYIIQTPKIYKKYLYGDVWTIEERTKTFRLKRREKSA